MDLVLCQLKLLKIASKALKCIGITLKKKNKSFPFGLIWPRISLSLNLPLFSLCFPFVCSLWFLPYLQCVHCVSVYAYLTSDSLSVWMLLLDLSLCLFLLCMHVPAWCLTVNPNILYLCVLPCHLPDVWLWNWLSLRKGWTTENQASHGIRMRYTLQKSLRSLTKDDIIYSNWPQKSSIVNIPLSSIIYVLFQNLRWIFKYKFTFDLFAVFRKWFS